MFKVSGGRTARKLSASLIVLITGAVMTAFAVPVTATAASDAYGGWAQATAVHADVLNITGIHVVNAEVGQAGAAVAKAGLQAVYNEYGRPIVPKKFAGKNSYGNSSVLEAGLGVDKDTIDQIQPFYGESAAPGGPGAVDKSVVDTGSQADPLLYLDLAYEDWKKRGIMTDLSHLRDAIYHGAVKRVRPKAMTACVIIAGLAPILWSHGTGADVMKRIAAPLIGGQVTSFMLELTVYPAIFAVWKGRALPSSPPSTASVTTV
jgi:hypothetical protein